MAFGAHVQLDVLEKGRALDRCRDGRHGRVRDERQAASGRYSGRDQLLLAAAAAAAASLLCSRLAAVAVAGARERLDHLIEAGRGRRAKEVPMFVNHAAVAISVVAVAAENGCEMVLGGRSGRKARLVVQHVMVMMLLLVWHGVAYRARCCAHTIVAASVAATVGVGGVGVGGGGAAAAGHVVGRLGLGLGDHNLGNVLQDARLAQRFGELVVVVVVVVVVVGVDTVAIVLLMVVDGGQERWMMMRMRGRRRGDAFDGRGSLIGG